jgi:hypothetical protein
MSNIYLEWNKKAGIYVATQNGRRIATGETQADAGARAHRRNPDDPILAERVNVTNRGKPDKSRRFYPSK